MTCISLTISSSSSAMNSLEMLDTVQFMFIDTVNVLNIDVVQVRYCSMVCNRLKQSLMKPKRNQTCNTLQEFLEFLTFSCLKDNSEVLRWIFMKIVLCIN